jgi:hypothetical protein
MSTARIQLATTGYRIAVGPGEDDVSAEFDFGEAAEFEAANGKRYVAFVDVADESGLVEGGDVEAENVESPFEYWLYEATPVDGEPEDVGSFDGDVEEEDEDEDEEEETPAV